MLKLLVDYHVYANVRVMECVNALDAQGFVSDDEYSRGSIRNLLVHLASTDRRLLARLTGEAEPDHLDPADYADRAATRSVLKVSAERVQQYCHSLDAGTLDVGVEGLPLSRGEVLAQLVLHGVDHRATILERVHRLGGPTFEQDFGLWLLNTR